MKLPDRRGVLTPVAFYLLAVALLVAGVLAKTGGHFVYALDDPYIHLALAENLAHGHYGINPGEFSSPASSIVWPFLLIPLVGTRAHVLLPLILNVAFGVLAAGLLGRVVAGWAARRGWGWGQQAVAGMVFVIAANLPSLTIVGMEHVLQVLLAIACAAGVLRALDGETIPAWALGAAVAAPMVRYEGVALTMAMCLALLGARRWRAAVAVGVGAALPLVAFSAFLRRLGLPALPLSVLVKGDVSQVSDLGERIQVALKTCLVDAVTKPERYAVLGLTLIVIWMAARERRVALAGAAGLGVLQLVIGRFGWFYRYEVYAVIFLAMIVFGVLVRRPGFRFYELGLVAVCATTSFVAMATTVGSSLGIYREQYQMHRFVTEFYRGDYAVNDLGLASFERRPGARVLDVFGLGSLEAAEQDDKTPEWLEEIVRRHRVGLVMLYPEWFDDMPESWTRVGRMCEVNPPVSIGEPCVSFFSSSAEGTAALRDEVRTFARTLPPGVSMALE